MWTCRQQPVQQRSRRIVPQTVRGSESDQLPLRAGLWQLCWSGKGKRKLLAALSILYMWFITHIHILSPQENAHFSISESLIAAIELMKCNMRRPVEEAEEEGDSDTEIQQLKQKIRLRRLQIRRTRMKPPTSSDNRKTEAIKREKLKVNRMYIMYIYCFISTEVPSVDSGGSRRSSQDSFHPSDSGSDRDVEDIELKGRNSRQEVHLWLRWLHSCLWSCNHPRDCPHYP